MTGTAGGTGCATNIANVVGCKGCTQNLPITPRNGRISSNTSTTCSILSVSALQNPVNFLDDHPPSSPISYPLRTLATHPPSLTWQRSLACFATPFYAAFPQLRLTLVEYPNQVCLYPLASCKASPHTIISCFNLNVRKAKMSARPASLLWQSKNHHVYLRSGILRPAQS